MRIKTRHVKTIYWIRSLRIAHTCKHSRNPYGNSIKHLSNIKASAKSKPWPCLVMKLNFITIAWNFGFLEYSSSHFRGIKAKIRPSNKAITGEEPYNKSTFHQRCLQLLYSSCSLRSQTPLPTTACFALASLAFSFACEAVNSLGIGLNQYSRYWIESMFQD